MTETTTTTIPDGWKLVPIEPTHEMMQAAYKPVGNALYDNPFMDTSKGWGERGAEVYRAMLCAAPSPSPAAPSAAQNASLWEDQVYGARVCTIRDGVNGVEIKDCRDGTFELTIFDRDEDCSNDLTAYRMEPSDFARMAAATLPAAPGAQPSQGGSVSEAADDAPTYRIRITPDMTYDQINAAAAAEEARVDAPRSSPASAVEALTEALEETAKRIMWAIERNGPYNAGTADGRWHSMPKESRARCLRAALAAARKE